MKQVSDEKNKKQNIGKPKLEKLFSKVRFEEGFHWAEVGVDRSGRIDHSCKRIIVSNNRLDKALVGSEEWRNIVELLPCLTGTLVAYASPGSRLGETVECSDREDTLWVFPVPKEHQGKKDAILVAEHPNYRLEREINREPGDRHRYRMIVQDAQVDLIDRFPDKDGWYFADPKHGIPFGDLVDERESDARYLMRRDFRVASVKRGDNGHGPEFSNNLFRRVIRVDIRLGRAEGGMLVESPASENGSDIIKGLTLEELQTLVRDANADLQDLLKEIRPEKLAAIQRLLQALDEKE